MTSFLPSRLSAIAMLCTMSLALMVSGCASNNKKGPTVYDLGPLAPMQQAPIASMTAPTSTGNVSLASSALQPITVADITSAGWLDNEMMHYRLSYASELQPRPYSNSRWSMSPPQLLGQRIKARIAQAGGVVLSAADGAVGVPTLRIETIDFSQRFGSSTESDVHVGIRATVFNGRTLVAQKNFNKQRLAPTPDAAGAAVALAGATDSLITDLINWLAAIPVKK